ncbi:MAG: transposase [Acidobacteriota bacterium]
MTDLKYHVIWVTKYRYKILRGDIAERARDLIGQICLARVVTIIRGAVSPSAAARLSVGKESTGFSR